MNSKNKSFNGTAFSILFLVAVFAVGAFNTSAQEKEQKEKEQKQNAKIAKQAKITMAQAREIAQKAAAGTIEDEELEKEHGKLVYSFDIRNEKGTITEVQVDAKTGKVVSTEEETKEDEAKEKREDEMKAKKKGKN